MIAAGEGLKLDFKYCISDSRKIARTLSAFANTEGGTLLIGVRDNGAIAGVRDDEEIYMIETASRLFCKPEIPVTIKHHTIEGKTVLEVKVEKGGKRPYKAKSDDGRWRSYSRQNDQNILANSVLLEIWRKEKMKRGVMVTFTEAENMLMNHLRNKGSITLSGLRRLTGINNNRARQILVNLILLDVLEMKITEKGTSYYLASPVEPPCTSTES
jgi:predicted HTH transcriptional regulator